MTVMGASLGSEALGPSLRVTMPFMLAAGEAFSVAHGNGDPSHRPHAHILLQTQGPRAPGVVPWGRFATPEYH